MTYQKPKNELISEIVQVIESLIDPHVHDLIALTNTALKTIVTFFGAGMGSVFLVNHDQHESFLEMMSCYNGDYILDIKKNIYLNDGLAAQVYKDGDAILLRDVPATYVDIESYRGGPLTFLAIVTLKTPFQKIGVLELAFSRHIEDDEFDLLKTIAAMTAIKIAESQMQNTEYASKAEKRAASMKTNIL